ncbi:hypothetical protein EBE87_00745 [Pseudoroseomonas wenyumeiae]|uniref:Uncharacterized protein n=1 Tax=Teichococcus wenyumeiae TaxID=2478470 RepID=A0A3A9J5P8_9PROT|nr:hypothetical protein [Pseudoroseomonas wenyumeiae]RKK01001.1 hypothetical protein D6Z83_27330 [Pseudoroseomonas wenyumeiae]RMI26948.1 hypothetical protein EBE87_00745 [Pseudoroseomonas wenyumeiae]
MSGGGKTPQGPGAQGPGNAHGTPAEHEPDTEDKPFDPEGGKPASDTEAMAWKVLDYANKGPSAGRGAGPEGAGGKPTGSKPGA